MRASDTNLTVPITDGTREERPAPGRADVPGPPPAAEIAAQATRLILLGYGASLSAADRDQLERSVLAQVEAVRVLRRYPLLNSDEPMYTVGQTLGEPR